MQIEGETLKRILARIFNVDVAMITDNASPDTIDSWDSLRHMNLVLALEEEFDVNLTDDQITEIPSYRLIKIVPREQGMELI